MAAYSFLTSITEGQVLISLGTSIKSEFWVDLHRTRSQILLIIFIGYISWSLLIQDIL